MGLNLQKMPNYRKHCSYLSPLCKMVDWLHTKTTINVVLRPPNVPISADIQAKGTDTSPGRSQNWTALVPPAAAGSPTHPAVAVPAMGTSVRVTPPATTGCCAAWRDDQFNPFSDAVPYLTSYRDIRQHHRTINPPQVKVIVIKKGIPR